MPQLDITFYFSQVFWLLIVFGVLLGVIRFVLSKNIKDNIEARARRLEKMDASVLSLREEVRNLTDNYNGSIAEAEKKARLLISDMMAKTEVIKVDKLKELSTTVEQMLSDGDRKIFESVSELEPEIVDLVHHLIGLYTERLTKSFTILACIDSSSVEVESGREVSLFLDNFFAVRRK